MSTLQEKARCVKRVYAGTFSGHQCTKPAVRDGFCTIHHPEYVLAKQNASRAKWEQEYAEKRRKAHISATRAAVGEHFMRAYCLRTGISEDDAHALDVIAFYGAYENGDAPA